MKCILLTDDDFGLRSALRLLLEIRLSVKVILEASEIENVLDQVGDLQPDCIILDWELLDRTAPGQLHLLRTLVPGIKVIALGTRPESKERALKEGVDVFISKTELPSVVLAQFQQLCQAAGG
jgi:DNA-binding NarL/FixJ family response regulator